MLERLGRPRRPAPRRVPRTTPTRCPGRPRATPSTSSASSATPSRRRPRAAPWGPPAPAPSRGALSRARAPGASVGRAMARARARALCAHTGPSLPNVSDASCMWVGFDTFGAPSVKLGPLTNFAQSWTAFRMISRPMSATLGPLNRAMLGNRRNLDQSRATWVDSGAKSSNLGRSRPVRPIVGEVGQLWRDPEHRP